MAVVITKKPRLSARTDTLIVAKTLKKPSMSARAKLPARKRLLARARRLSAKPGQNPVKPDIIDKHQIKQQAWVIAYAEYNFYPKNCNSPQDLSDSERREINATTLFLN